MCHAQAFSMECLSLKQNVKGKVFSIDCFPLIFTHIEAIRSANSNCLEFPLSTHKLTDENKTSKSFELKLYNYLQLTFPVNKVGKVSLGFFYLLRALLLVSVTEETQKKEINFQCFFLCCCFSSVERIKAKRSEKSIYLFRWQALKSLRHRDDVRKWSENNKCFQWISSSKF